MFCSYGGFSVIIDFQALTPAADDSYNSCLYLSIVHAL